MKAKVIVSFLALGILFLTAGMLGGCGETEHSSSSYYYPNWMSDGRIVCWKVVSRWSEALFGRKELGTTAYITAMNSDGSNETNIFEDSGWGGEIVCSPTGEMIGYIAYPDKLTIVNSDGANKRVVLNIASGCKYFDWSPDATKIAYSASNILYVINVDGTNNTQVASSAEAVAWRVGEKIAYEDSIYNKIWISSMDGSSKEVVVAEVSSRPQISNNSMIVFRGAGNWVKTINMNGMGGIELFSGYERTTLKLSFDNTKIAGGDLVTGGGSDIGGIWVTNISDGKSTNIR